MRCDLPDPMIPDIRENPSGAFERENDSPPHASDVRGLAGTRLGRFERSRFFCTNAGGDVAGFSICGGGGDLVAVTRFMTSVGSCCLAFALASSA